MQSRIATVLGPKVVHAVNLDNLTFRSRMDALDAGGQDNIEAWLLAHPAARLVVIDVLGRVKGIRRPNEEPFQYDYRVMAGLQELAARFRVAIVVVHHVRKSDAEDVLDTVSGTTGIAAAADTVIVLGRAEHGVRFYMRGRDCEEQDKELDFDPDTGIWSVTGDYEEAVPVLQGLRRKIADVLASSPVPLTPAQVAERTGDKAVSVRGVLRRMAKAVPPQAALAPQPAGSYQAP
jgi:hypothetical protein